MARLGALLAGIVGSAACASKVEDLPPYGEALLVVDNDLPRTLASRLRVDLYSDSGRWFESRDIGRSDPRDWPASFSVYSDDPTTERRVLVRLRVYPEGLTRRYEGERFAARPTYTPPVIPQTLAELCANAPLLPIGGRVTLFRGSKKLTDTIGQDNCTGENTSGSVAARITIDKLGTYRFSVADMWPYESDARLFLRSQCEEPSTQLGCRDEPTAPPNASGHFPRLDAKLAPGTYWVMTGGVLADWPATTTLEALAVDGTPEPLPPHVTDEVVAPKAHGPRLARADGETHDESPDVEPLPSAAIDRLVGVRLVPGRRGSLSVMMRANCTGTMAQLGADPTLPALDSATTCVDTENVRVPVGESELDPTVDRHPTAVGRAPAPVGGAQCSDADKSDSSFICHPSAAFLLGSPGIDNGYGTPMSATPARIAIVDRFFMDRTEVSVARVRNAVLRGLAVQPESFHVNDGAYGTTTGKLDQDFLSYCTFSMTAPGREELPANCVSWSFARAFCRAEGGDLPTEAQWEYAAIAAGRERKTRYAWGNDDPTCERVSMFRFPNGPNGSGTCLPDGVTVGGPEPVGAHSGTDGQPGDVTPLGVVGMHGNVGEWTLDAGEAYASDCWSGSPLRNPGCYRDDAPYRAMRGSTWTDPPWGGTTRGFFPSVVPSLGRPPGQIPLPIVGFRCAYSERPRR